MLSGTSAKLYVVVTRQLTRPPRTVTVTVASNVEVNARTKGSPFGLPVLEVSITYVYRFTSELHFDVSHVLRR